ncbi:MAG: signal recognition particle protein, partial [Oscillospiraceae bacterium]|nr:signal recognition particle protein [Oscillospiraceae bacterium]
PAAIEQLKVVGAKAEVPVFERGQIKPIEIVKSALAHAKDYGNDYVIIDTAGRLHIDEELMAELLEIRDFANPSDILLVVDAMIGQDAVNVAKTFNDTLEISGVVLTKLDGDTRGGAALSIRAVTGKPIKFVGMGEKLDDIEPFYPDRMASRILGMGDVLSFIEKAQNEIDEKEAEKVARKLQENSFDMDDLLSQIKQVKKMGSIGQILSMLPGGNKINADDIDEKQFVRMEAMINSMTKKERAKPQIINPQRKRRIAAGSGTRVEDVNLLLRQFEQMQKMMKQFTGKGGKKRLASLGSMMGKGKLPF